MLQPFPDRYKEIADSMGIALYQRFSTSEASLFLRCPASDIRQLQENGKLSFIRVTETENQFFGYQLLGYLLNNVTGDKVPRVCFDDVPDRILRAKEVAAMVGLSRTTIWRREKNGVFPARISLGSGSVGWKYNEVRQWMQERQSVTS